MKKFLSLVLALAMTLSLVTISAGAKDFADSDELSGEQYEEAVNVMSEMGIIDGYAGGNFQPQGTLTRGAAAKIIACMMLGKTTAEALGTQAAPFKDVPAGSTFAGYIAYCVESGLIDGYADGTFRPQNTLTGFAFLKMLLTALGYDSAIEGYTGTNWTVNVAGRATQIGLTDGNDEFVGTRAATREEACLYAVNALQTTLVEYESKGTNVTVNGATVAIGASKPTFVTSSIAGAATSIDDTIDNTTHDYTVEFAERYQPDLELDRDIDVFGRPSHTWAWNGKDIGTYVDYDKLIETYTTAITGKDLYDLLGKGTIEDYDIDVYVDGETASAVLGSAYFSDKNMIKTNTETVGETGNGVLTEVFMDTDAKEISVVVINTYLAIAEDDYDEKRDEVTFEVWGIDETSTKDAYVKDTDETEVMPAVSGEDFDIEDVVDGDIVRVTVADGEIQTIDDVEALEDVTITRFTKGKNVTADGTQYDYADAAMYDDEVLDNYDADNMKEQTYNVYLDEYGYLLGIEIVDKVSQYLFVTGMNGGTDNLANKRGSANVIFLDGTTDTVDVNLTKSNVAANALVNTWCKYSVDKNDVYTLTVVSYAFDEDADKVGQSVLQKNTDAAGDYSFKTIDKKNTTLPGSGDLNYVYGNDASIYMTVNTTEINTTTPGGLAIVVDDVNTITTGIRNVSLKAYSAKQAVAETDDVNNATRYTPAGAQKYEDYVTSGVYTLFNDDGYVIAAIVVGEDDGTTSNYAYVTSKDGKDGLNYEGYDSTTEDYTWTRTVIINGEEVELTEVTDTNPELATMEQNEWYEVKYYADGTVRGVNKLTFAAAGKYINAIENIETALNSAYDTILLFDYMPDVYSLSCKGDTFYATSGVKSGFVVAPDANIVLVQDKKVVSTGDVTPMDDIQYFDNGVDGIEKAFKRMNDNENFVGYISAVFEDGVATSVIIYDCTATEIEDGGIDQDANYITKAIVDENTMTVTVKALPTATDKTAAVISSMRAAGYTDISVSSGIVTGYKDSVRYTFGVTAYDAYEVTFALGAGFTGVSIDKNGKAYMAEGDQVTLTLSKDDDTAFSSVPAAAAVTATSDDTNTDAYDVTAVGGKNGDKTITITVTQIDELTDDAANTVTLSK